MLTNADIQHIIVIESRSPNEEHTGTSLYYEVIERLRQFYGVRSSIQSSSFFSG